ncbi:MAG: hypothetical protein QME92_03150 [Bacillota bacterium]|nr:hypothetical protein [Bacillota bacterium]
MTLAAAGDLAGVVGAARRRPGGGREAGEGGTGQRRGRRSARVGQAARVHGRGGPRETVGRWATKARGVRGSVAGKPALLWLRAAW